LTALLRSAWASAARIEPDDSFPAAQPWACWETRWTFVYPKENKKLYTLVEQRGAIITEFPLGFHPAPETLGVVVVDDAQYSSSLITARLAMEFDREAFGVPGNVTQPTRFAPNQLIKYGAKPVTTGEDVVEELRTSIRRELFPVETTPAEKRASPFERALARVEKEALGPAGTDEPRQVDGLVGSRGRAWCGRSPASNS
jgi:predicted Rossmann fold nucleotide-binding protein DprA/Smf involved in DNA uptake